MMRLAASRLSLLCLVILTLAIGCNPARTATRQLANTEKPQSTASASNTQVETISVPPPRGTPTMLPNPSHTVPPPEAPQYSLQLTFMAEHEPKVYGVYAITLGCPDEFPPCLSEPELLFEDPHPGLLTGSTLSWSPDGKRLAFVSVGEAGKLDIYLIDWNGQNLVNLTNSPVNENFPAWSPDGSWISFDSCGHEGCQVFRIKPDRTHREQLLRLADVNNPSEPGWSPDGRQLTFTGYDEKLFPAHVYVANLDGSSFVQVTHQESLDSSSPAFSPDGHWIVFEQDVSVPDNLGGINPNIFLVKPDGSGETWLAKDVWANQFFPSWSLSGDWISFSSHNYDEDKYDLYLIKPDGTHMLNVTNTPGIFEGPPAWRIVRTP